MRCGPVSPRTMSAIRFGMNGVFVYCQPGEKKKKKKNVSWKQFTLFRDGRALRSHAQQRCGDEKSTFGVISNSHLLLLSLRGGLSIGSRCELKLGKVGFQDVTNAFSQLHRRGLVRSQSIYFTIASILRELARSH